jgi:hypothetical protein
MNFSVWSREKRNIREEEEVDQEQVHPHHIPMTRRNMGSIMMI